MPEPQLILAIESAIGGGSLSLFRGDEKLGGWQGEGGTSRAEDLLSNIDLILQSNKIDKKELSLIAVSVGPGSFTGIRIGLATAMGLATALNIELLKFSILHAMATLGPDGESLMTAVPVGRSVVCTQRFQKNSVELMPIGEPVAMSAVLFDREEIREGNFVLTPEDISGGLADCLAAAAIDERVSQSTEPLFIAKPESL